MKKQQLEELLLQSLEHELGGVKVYAKAIECDHLDWELLSKCAKQLKGGGTEELEAACDEIEDQEDEHIYHSKGWCRELWIESLGLSPVLPPPEEQKHVKTAIGAARAEQAAEKAR